MLKLHKINIHFTTPKNPQSNANVEKFHSTLTKHLRILQTERKDEQPENLIKYALIAYNSSIHSATNMTPFTLTFRHTSVHDPSTIIMYDTEVHEYYVKKHK